MYVMTELMAASHPFNCELEKIMSFVHLNVAQERRRILSSIAIIVGFVGGGLLLDNVLNNNGRQLCSHLYNCARITLNFSVLVLTNGVCLSISKEVQRCNWNDQSK